MPRRSGPARGSLSGAAMVEPRSRHEVTEVLLRWNEDGKRAVDELMPLVNDELRRLAGRFLQGEAAGHTLQPTALVNECYLRLVDREKVDWRGRAHFFGFAVRTMRRILVEHARARRSAKRGGGVRVVPLEEAEEPSSENDLDLLALEQALRELERLDARQSRVVELRFFGGLTIPEMAEVLGVSEATVSREWTSARAWLTRELRGPRKSF